MDAEEKLAIIESFKRFFKETVVANHVPNTEKCSKLSAFQVNPFLAKYLANYLTGNGDSISIAKALIYPRILGTSPTTSFGSNFQKFISVGLGAYGSGISGIDIEFIDQIDGRRKYCQLKAGPQTINADDVPTISNHFNELKNRARTNNLSIELSDMIVGILYSSSGSLSHNYRALEREYPIFVGRDFWHHLTGDIRFYDDLISAIGEAAVEADGSKLLQQTIEALAKDIEQNGHLF